MVVCSSGFVLPCLSQTCNQGGGPALLGWEKVTLTNVCREKNVLFHKEQGKALQSCCVKLKVQF